MLYAAAFSSAGQNGLARANECQSLISWGSISARLHTKSAPSHHAANCALGVEREISCSSVVMSAGTLANNGVLR